MKQTKQNQKVSFLKATILLIVLTISALNSFAQKSLALEIGQDITGSGLGANTCVGLTLNKNKNSLNFGANFQTKEFHLSGIQLNYRRTLASTENERIELYFLGNLTIHTSANISEKTIRLEQKCRPETSLNYDELSFKVVESYIGFGLKVNHTKRISTLLSASCGGFGTLNKDYDLKMQREKSAMSLRLRFAIIYNLKKNNK